MNGGTIFWGLLFFTKNIQPTSGLDQDMADTIIITATAMKHHYNDFFSFNCLCIFYLLLWYKLTLSVYIITSTL